MCVGNVAAFLLLTKDLLTQTWDIHRDCGSVVCGQW